MAEKLTHPSAREVKPYVLEECPYCHELHVLNPHGWDFERCCFFCVFDIPIGHAMRGPVAKREIKQGALL